MHIYRIQGSVALGMLLGLIISVVAMYCGAQLFTHLEIAEVFGISLLLPAVALFIAIARLAAHRFFTPADIGGSAFSAGTDQAKLLQALLQNTLEQLAFTVPVYLAALSSAYFLNNDYLNNSYHSLLASVPACACTFLLGRVLFFLTYPYGASARALGFALTFYPTVLLLAWQLWLLADSIIR